MSRRALRRLRGEQRGQEPLGPGALQFALRDDDDVEEEGPKREPGGQRPRGAAKEGVRVNNRFELVRSGAAGVGAAGGRCAGRGFAGRDRDVTGRGERSGRWHEAGAGSGWVGARGEEGGAIRPGAGRGGGYRLQQSGRGRAVEGRARSAVGGASLPGSGGTLLLVSGLSIQGLGKHSRLLLTAQELVSPHAGIWRREITVDAN